MFKSAATAVFRNQGLLLSEILRSTKMVASQAFSTYGVATISRLLKIEGLFCKKSPINETIFCKRHIKIFKIPRVDRAIVWISTLKKQIWTPDHLRSPQAYE